MILTEEAAAQRWCPHVRIPLYAAKPNDAESPTSANRTMPGTHEHAVDAVEAATRCIGSACMAWRWWDARYEGMITTNETAPNPAGTAPVRLPPSGEGWVRAKPDEAEPYATSWARPLGERRRGYCGLAGSPGQGDI